MIRRSTTPVLFSIRSLQWLLLAILPAIVIVTAVIQTSAGAESNTDTQSRIDQLTKKIDKQVSSSRALNKQSASLSSQINALAKERDYLSTQIQKNTDDQAALAQRISTMEKELQLRRSALGSIMADMYVTDSISSLELLASSSSVADFIDNQTLRESVRTQLADSIGTVKTIAADLANQKKTLARVAGDQANQKIALHDKQTEQTAMLVASQDESGQLTKITAAMAAERKKLQTSQQADIAAHMGGAEQVISGTISVPVASDPPPPKPVTLPSKEDTSQSSDTTPAAPKPTPAPTPKPVILPNGGYPSNLQNCYVDSNALSYGIDPWGYGCRQCVSYTAWKVLQKTGHAAMYWGNAKQWPASARRVGYETGTTPRSGSVAVMTSGPYGHVAWVESVNGNGTVNVSQYNYWLPGKSNGGWGWYSEFRNVSARTYQAYIYI